MTGYQIFALSMPVITAVGVGLTGLFVQWHWAEKRRDPEREAALHPVGEDINVDLDRAIRLIDGVRRKLQTHA